MKETICSTYMFYKWFLSQENGCIEELIALKSDVTLYCLLGKVGGEFWTSLFSGADELRTFSDMGWGGVGGVLKQPKNSDIMN